MIQLIGKGGMAREVAAYYMKREKVSPILVEFEEIKKLSEYINSVIAIGDPFVRKSIAEEYGNKLKFGILNFGKFYVKYEELTYADTGTIICPRTILTTNVSIGKHCLINLNCMIHHDVVIGNFVTVSPSTTICGNVTIGDLCFIGANTVIREKIKICSNVIIGAGSVVVKDITEPGTYIGNPCKKLL